MQFFTICASNYLALAKTLAASVRRVYPEVKLQIFLLNDAHCVETEAYRLRHIGEALDEQDRLQRLLRYNILEFSTSVKAAVFRTLFQEGCESVVYLDPDIELFSRLDEVHALFAEGRSGAIVPHMLSPLPRDGEHPDDFEILRTGTFNLGFLALNATRESTALVEWWDEWLKTHCWGDPSTGVFTDQKWLDFVPAMWPGVAVLRHPGYDVAYWNLHERALARSDQGWSVNDQVPLRFFHFSGFNPGHPRVLSKYDTRHTSVRSGALAEMLQAYAAQLLQHGHLQHKLEPLPTLRFSNGAQFDVVARSAYAQAEARGLKFSRILEVGDGGGFHEWLTGRVAGSRHSRYVHALLDLRQDVRTHFGDLEETQAEALCRWIVSNGMAEQQLDPQLLKDAGVIGMAAGVDASPSVNFIGYLRAESGVGEAARGYVKALGSANVRLALMDISNLTSYKLLGELEPLPLRDEMPPAPYGVNWIHVNADMLPATIEHFGQDLCDGRYSVGFWAWESEHFPAEWGRRAQMVDEIWVGSTFMAKAIAPCVDVPVLTFPHVVELPQVAPERERFGMAPDEFVFLFSFDFHSFVERKNPAAVIRAFNEAFAACDKARLLIKTTSGAAFPSELDELSRMADGVRVRIWDETLERRDMLALLASVDSYVSLHRLEGFGLGMAEAMAMGKPVIATGYGGNTDFMTVGDALLIPFELVELERAVGPYQQGSRWAEPDVAAAVAAMRQLYDDREQAAALGRRARRAIESRLSAVAVGKRLRDRLEHIERSACEKARARSVRVPPPVSRVRRRIERVLSRLAAVVRNPRRALWYCKQGTVYLQRQGLRATLRKVRQVLAGA